MFIHGKNAEIEIVGVTCSAYFDSIDLSIETDTADASVFGMAWKQNVAGQSSATLELSGKYDSTENNGPIDLLEGLRSTPGEVVVYPQGNVAGRHSYTGDFLLTSLAVSAPVGGIVAFTASLVSNGEVVKGTVS